MRAPPSFPPQAPEERRDGPSNFVVVVDHASRRIPRRLGDLGLPPAELERHIAFLRSLGAPDDAHPRVGVNDDYEVTVMICVVERPAPQTASAT